MSYVLTENLIPVSDPMDESCQKAIEHFDKLINSPQAPELPAELADSELMRKLHEQFLLFRKVVKAFAEGDMSHDILFRGFIAGGLKTLQAHLRHLTWQVQQVEQDDYTQRAAFMGEFSSAFNKMVERLELTVSDLRQKEEELTKLNEELRSEINLRNTAMRALRASEARFKYLAGHDPLTGVLNRRSFMDKAQEVLVESHRKGRPCCIVMLDVDSFKRFNDTHGHLAGDAALQHIVGVCQLALRKRDLMGRYGGEEFIFCFGNTSLKHGTSLAERMRQAIEESSLGWDGKALKLTASFGVSVALPGEGGEEPLRFVINTADNNLYESKNSGRNRVVASQPGRIPQRRDSDY